jgi:hypothetical protein
VLILLALVSGPGRFKPFKQPAFESLIGALNYYLTSFQRALKRSKADLGRKARELIVH